MADATPLISRLASRLETRAPHMGAAVTRPLRQLLYRGRIVAGHRALVPLEMWSRVRRFASVEIGAGAVVHRGAIDLVEGRLELGPDSVLHRTERLRIGRDGQFRTGARCVIEPGARIVVLGQLILGDDVYIGRDAVIVARERVEIGAGALLAERVSIHDENHGPPHDRQTFRVKPVSIGAHTWIAAGVVVTSGSSVGAETTVAANAVVSGDVPAGVLAGGLPARVIRPYV